MEIRKQFKFEAGHIVRNATTKRCSHSYHGHSYIVEVFLSASKLDNAGMICDFTLLKNFGIFIDMFDHSTILWEKDVSAYKEQMKLLSDRWIEMNENPSAEQMSLFFLFWLSEIIRATDFHNGEGRIEVTRVRVHETATGYAEAISGDTLYYAPDWHFNMSDDVYHSIPKRLQDFIEHRQAWENGDNIEDLRSFFINPHVEQQIRLD